MPVLSWRDLVDADFEAALLVDVDIAVSGSDGRFVDGRVRSVHFEHEDGRPVPDAIGRAAALMDRFGRRDFPGSAATIDGSEVVRTPSQRN